MAPELPFDYAEGAARYATVAAVPIGDIKRMIRESDEAASRGAALSAGIQA